MTIEELIRMAREVGAIHIHGKPNEFAIVGNDSIKAFAALVAAAEPAYDQTALELCEVCGWKTLIPGDVCLNCEHEAAAQRQSARSAWVGLTDEDREDAWRNALHEAAIGESTATKCFARAIEAKLKEKNT